MIFWYIYWIDNVIDDNVVVDWDVVVIVDC